MPDCNCNMNSRIGGEHVTKEEARRKQEAHHAVKVAAHKERQFQKMKEKILEKAERYSFLNTTPGYTSETRMSPTSKDEEMKKARANLQRSYNAGTGK